MIIKKPIILLIMSLVVIMSACSHTSNSTASKSEQSSQSNTDSSKNTPSTTKTNSSGNNEDSTASADKTKSPTDSLFDPVIADAMEYVKDHTKISLMAPAKADFKPNVQYMSAKATADQKSYSVNLISTDKPIPLNSPTLSSVEYDDMNKLIGRFSATAYSSPEDAKAQLHKSYEGDIAPAYQPPPDSESTKVDLGHGITGTAYSSFPMVEWNEGKWTLQVWDGTLEQDIQEAQKIVAFLDTNLLPPTDGVFGENLAGDGQHTTAAWAYGNTVYSTFSYQSGLMAAEMAAASRVYPDGQSMGRN
ncbi:hypothetical protein [Falsibacillus albus]|uniref:Uncharacterized protein n=1 Tax=Falsibacillus albus TaxID=2478915 RepID=A0A3L7JY63_9BACI|nr:hypothetical protein [Falsibacillus albus]RLQ94621.1 hypothetical protein D9X91_13890 [Falsibacillus albus]